MVERGIGLRGSGGWRGLEHGKVLCGSFPFAFLTECYRLSTLRKPLLPAEIVEI